MNLDFPLLTMLLFSQHCLPHIDFSLDKVTVEFICVYCLYSPASVLTEQSQAPPPYSPGHHIVGMALGHRAGTQGSSEQLHRVLHRYPRQHPALAEHCPAAGCRRVYSKE